MATSIIQNPIIPGFYSDPSVLRDGEDYYLVCSSFEFFPGLPLFHSRDLVNWSQLSNCLTTEIQLPLAGATTSDGIYAPTLRKHKDTFYLITANRCAPRGNHFYVTSKHPAQGFGEPVWIRDMEDNFPEGLDPSLFFDDDGKVYFSCVAWDDQGQGIGQAQIDLSTGRLLAPLSIVWHGTGGTFPEGPHTYKINGWYYLMIAEGGTEYGHKVTIARSRNVEGPYESCPHNPILTQNYQKSQSCGIQGVGHGDLLQDTAGNWWLIVHGFRPSIGKLHHLGRETLLVPVTWDEAGWPVANQTGRIGETISMPPGYEKITQRTDYSTCDTFCEATLPPYWNFQRNPSPESYCWGKREGLTLYGTPVTLQDCASPTWLGRRQQHFDCQVHAVLRFTPLEGEEAGLTVFQTNEHHYDLVIARRDGRIMAFLRKVVGDIELELSPTELSGNEFSLTIQASRETYAFEISDYYGSHFLGTGRTQLLSTEAMQYQNFTGTFFAMFACSGAFTPSPAVFSLFEYMA